MSIIISEDQLRRLVEEVYRDGWNDSHFSTSVIGSDPDWEDSVAKRLLVDAPSPRVQDYIEY